MTKRKTASKQQKKQPAKAPPKRVPRPRRAKPDRARFAVEYLKDMNATQAAIRCGYSERTARSQGSRLLTSADVSAAVEKARTRILDEAEVDAAWVIKRLKQVAERCMQAEPVTDREGQPTGEYRFDSTGANKALDLLGKTQKMFTDKTELTGKDGAPLAPAVVQFYMPSNGR